MKAHSKSFAPFCIRYSYASEMTSDAILTSLPSCEGVEGELMLVSRNRLVQGVNR